MIVRWIETDWQRGIVAVKGKATLDECRRRHRLRRDRNPSLKTNKTNEQTFARTRLDLQNWTISHHRASLAIGGEIVRACTYILYNIVNQMYMHCSIDMKSISISTWKPPGRHATMAQSCFTATCQNCFNIPECVCAYVQRKIFVFRGTSTISSNNNETTIYKVIASLTPKR
jgi:hypothetical protein